jgi:hypothetical protein
MNTNHTILDALNAQLKLKKSDVVTFEETVKKQNTEEVNAGVLTWMQMYVDNSIISVNVNDSEIRVYATESKNDGIAIYKRSNWFSNKADRKHSCELSWYSSCASSVDTEKLKYLSVLGNIANCFLAVEDQYLNTWSKLLKAVDDQSSQMYSEIYKIERSISEVTENIKKDTAYKYKQLGFEMTSFAKSSSCSWNNDGTRSIKENDPVIKLQYGRSKWDKLYVKSYKVLSTTKGKYSLLVTQMHGATETTVEVTASRMDQFVNDILDWETRGSKQEAENAKSIYDRYLKTLAA